MLQQEQKYQGYEDDPANDGYQEYPEEEIETLYVFAYDPEESFWKMPAWNRHQIVAFVMGVLALAMIVGACFIPNGASYTITTITVPAHFSTQVYRADIAITPTGTKTYPAMQAKGVLTIFNGSFFLQSLPAGFIVTTHEGIEIATDQAVTIPANNPPSNGEASVSAHALIAGTSGNIQAGAINAIYGSSLFMKNLAAFTDGRDAFTKTYATSDDKAKALETAKSQVAASQPIGLLANPCTETIQQTESNVSVFRSCTFVTYQAPKNLQILSVHIQGANVVLTMRIIARVVTSHFVK